jgi:hypothetical protein
MCRRERRDRSLGAKADCFSAPGDVYTLDFIGSLATVMAVEWGSVLAGLGAA